MTMKRNIRRRRASTSSSEESDGGEGTVHIDLTTVKEMQKLRKRPKGLSAEELAVAGSRTSEPDSSAAVCDGDVYKMGAGGGMVDMKKLAKQKQQETFGKSFEAETNRRDEDANMLKFIEKELAKRRGAVVEDEATESQRVAKSNILDGVDECLRPTIAKRPEGMLSAQMLMGIPEVDLGIQEKIRNIESTEDAKQQLLQEMTAQKAQQNQEPDFVPTNMAVNFVQHSRWNNAEIDRQTKRSIPKPVTVKEQNDQTFRVGDFERFFNSEDKKRTLTAEKSSDDACFQKFKAQAMERRKK